MRQRAARRLAGGLGWALICAGAEAIQLVPDPDFALAAALDCLARDDAACAERALDDLPPGADSDDPVLRSIRERIARLDLAGRPKPPAASLGSDNASEAAGQSGVAASPSGYVLDDPRLLRLVRIDRIELSRAAGPQRGRRIAERAPLEPIPLGSETAVPPQPSGSAPSASSTATGTAEVRVAPAPTEPAAESAPPAVAQAVPAPPLEPKPPGIELPVDPVPTRPPAPELTPPAPKTTAEVAAAPAARPMIALELKDGSRVVVKELAFRAAGSDGSLQAPLPGAAFSTSRGIIVLRWQSMAELRILEQSGAAAGPPARVFLANGESIQLTLVNGVVSGPRPDPPGGEFSTSVHDLVAIVLPR